MNLEQFQFLHQGTLEFDPTDSECWRRIMFHPYYKDGGILAIQGRVYMEIPISVLTLKSYLGIVDYVRNDRYLKRHKVYLKLGILGMLKMWNFRRSYNKDMNIGIYRR